MPLTAASEQRRHAFGDGRVPLPHVGVVVDRLAVDLDPGVGGERAPAPAHAARRAAAIDFDAALSLEEMTDSEDGAWRDRDTTHISVVDRFGVSPAGFCSREVTFESE